MLLLGMDENAVVVRSTTSFSLERTWAEVGEEIRLMVIERDKHWEVGIAPLDKSEIFYRAEITKTMVAAVTDLGTVAVWLRTSHQLIHCRLIVCVVCKVICCLVRFPNYPIIPTNDYTSSLHINMIWHNICCFCSSQVGQMTAI